MKQWIIRSGSRDDTSLHLVNDAKIPTPGPREVLVRIKATSLNYRDELVLNGSYYGPLDQDIVPLSDGAGIVEAVGRDIKRFKVGDRVASQYYENWLDGNYDDEDKIGPPVGGPRQRGVLAEYVLLAENGTMPIPDNMSYEGAAALPVAGATAWNALFAHNPIRANDTVLVLGTGGVSMMALQMAKIVGARVIATSSRPEKMQRAKELGADEAINYNTEPEWGQIVRKLTGGAGVDKIIEVGGDGTLEQSMQAIAFDGEIALVGFLAASVKPPSAFRAIYRATKLRGIALGNARMFAAMTALFEHAGVAPVVDRVFPFADVVEAYRHKRSENMFGKVVIGVN